MIQLIYWPGLQGRGEFVRLILEDCEVAYDDVARRAESDGGGVEAVRSRLYGDGEQPGFAPPYLIDGDLVLAQSALVCAYVGEQFDRAPNDEDARWRARQLQCTIADVVDAVHDLHHPVSSSLYFEDQREEAIEAATKFREERLGKWLGYFEKCIETSGGPWLLGSQLSYPDLSLFQLVEGLDYAMPNALAAAQADFPGVFAVRDRVANRPTIAAYLSSERRVAFNEHGIFRHYPELDAPSPD